MTYPFAIDTTIPNAPNDPADDQPKMLVNTQNTVGFLEVDHIAPGSAGAGFHKQVTFYQEQATPTPSGTESVAYTIAGIADATKPQLVWTNIAATFPLSAIKAFGNFNRQTVAGAMTFLSSFNVVSGIFVPGIPNSYQITLTPGAVTGNNAAVTLGIGVTAGIVSYGFTGMGLLNIFDSSNIGGSQISFLVLQM